MPERKSELNDHQYNSLDMKFLGVSLTPGVNIVSSDFVLRFDAFRVA